MSSRINSSGIISVLGTIAGCLFPLWPMWLRQGVYYLSVCGLACFGLLIGVAVGGILDFQFFIFVVRTDICGFLFFYFI